MKFPDYSDAPAELLAVDGHCGPLAAWTVLRHFRKRTSAAKLLKACRYTRRHGVFAIGLAVALREHGLAVTFHTDPDRSPTSQERFLYARARHLGIAIEPALSLRAALAAAARGSVPIVLFQADRDPHFSPLIGRRRGRLLLPL